MTIVVKTAEYTESRKEGDSKLAKIMGSVHSTTAWSVHLLGIRSVGTDDGGSYHYTIVSSLILVNMSPPIVIGSVCHSKNPTASLPSSSHET